jgi:hypothetical protein
MMLMPNLFRPSNQLISLLIWQKSSGMTKLRLMYCMGINTAAEKHDEKLNVERVFKFLDKYLSERFIRNR